ncbi:hypothetical protein POM88_051479 [Heracleum sosnowskyi]|uniref:Uncharacterized protein n=1 Tax=Heracleum sosnowskyi TaxID=360622 RepID=A0AAD8H0P7_9APIA|nr:hypothetical protein POM88_051479 [Heracleum sosnowskyi]
MSKKMADNMYSSDGAAGQAQLRRDDQAQNSNFFNQTGDQVKTMAHGAADVASGAVQGTIFLAQGTATGAANVAQGASDIMRSTFGGGASNPSPNHSGKQS